MADEGLDYKQRLCQCCQQRIWYYTGYLCHECFWLRLPCCANADHYGTSLEESTCVRCGKRDMVHRMCGDRCRGCSPPWQIPNGEAEYIREEWPLTPGKKVLH